MSSVYSAVTNAQVTRWLPIDTVLMQKLADNLQAVYNDEGNGGSGIRPTATAFGTAFAVGGGHTHDGSDGQGLPVPTAGIANGGVCFPDEFGTGSVHNDNVGTGADGADTPKFADGGVAMIDLAGNLGQDINTTGPTPAAPKTVTHSLGRRPVVTNIGSSEFEVISTTSAHVVFGPNPNNLVDGYSIKCTLI